MSKTDWRYLKSGNPPFLFLGWELGNLLAGAVPKNWLAKPHRISAPQVLRSKELKLRPLSGTSAPEHRMRESRRFRFLLAMDCQLAAVAAEGAEAHCSEAPSTVQSECNPQFLRFTEH